MPRLVYDVESDGLLNEATKIWMIVAYNLDTDVTYKFTCNGTGHGTIEDGVRLLSSAELLVGHHIIGFDNRLIDKLYGTSLSTKPCHDTLIMSNTLRYKRDHRHGLQGWGEKLDYPKIDFDKEKFKMGDDPEIFKEMLRYCVQDVHLNVQVYKSLINELNTLSEKNPLIKIGLKNEHDTAKFSTTANTQGWNFDLEGAKELQLELEERMKEIEDIVEPKLGTYTVWIDKEPKTPKYKKNGDYNTHTCRWLSDYFGHPVEPGDTHLMTPGTEFQRSKQEQIKLGQVALVKEWLLSEGWKPDEYTRKNIYGKWVDISPKYTLSSLEKFGELGLLINEHNTLRSRYAVLNGWLDNVKDGRLHGDMRVWGTPVFRCAHSGIVNLPKDKWGKKLRGLLKADAGMVLVGADSAGNHLRGLAHFLKNPDFTNEIINGDQHQRNADNLKCSRDIAKSYLYAYIYGAGDAKLGKVLTGKSNPSRGRSSREEFAKGIKGLSELRERLQYVWKNNKYNMGIGMFTSIDGRPIFCEGEHQVLNYLLQSTEAITCKAAISYAMVQAKRAGIKAEPRLFMHDEMCWQVHPKDARAMGEILQDAFRLAPQEFGIDCMDSGDYVIADNYGEVH